MKRVLLLIGIMVCVLANGCFAAGARSILLFPGLTFYEGEEKLAGKLVFVASRPLLNPTNQLDGGVICELNLVNGKLRQLADTPSVEYFIASEQGNAYAILFPEEVPKRGEMMRAPWELLPTVAFLYCQDVRQSKSVRLPSRPKDIAIVGRHFFFQLDTFEGEPDFSTVTYGERIFHYDFDRASGSFLELPNASQWEREKFEMMHAHKGNANELHFYYHHHGARTRGGKDYPTATFYAYDVQSGRVEPTSHDDKDVWRFRTYDGQFVWFDGVNTPVSGTKLVKSKWTDEHDQTLMDPKGKSMKVLTKFSKFGGKIYRLVGISPCGHFALIRASAQKLGGPEANTYHIVDVSTGETRVILKDEVRLKTNGSVSSVRWIKSFE